MFGHREKCFSVQVMDGALAWWLVVTHVVRDGSSPGNHVLTILLLAWRESSFVSFPKDDKRIELLSMLVRNDKKDNVRDNC
jgi:hypothetical protein